MTDSSRVLIVAEMAWSHSGSLENALALIDGAAKAGADAVGIHLTSLSEYMTRSYRCVAGQTLSARGDEPGSSVYDYLANIDLAERDWEAVVARAREAGLQLVTMCNDEASLRFAERIRAADWYVISAASFTEHAFITRVAQAGRPLLLRIGGATLEEIETALALARAAGNSATTLLHGVQLYPTDIRDLNLSALPRLRAAFGCPVGLADHIDGDLPEAITLPALALAYGASVIEKHITTDRSERLEDYEAALGIEQFGTFVTYIRRAEGALGSGTLGVLGPADQRYRDVVRKRVVARRPLPANHVIADQDVAFKRADSGILVEHVSRVIGRRTARPLAVDDGIDLDVVEPA